MTSWSVTGKWQISNSTIQKVNTLYSSSNCKFYIMTAFRVASISIFFISPSSCISARVLAQLTWGHFSPHEPAYDALAFQLLAKSRPSHTESLSTKLDTSKTIKRSSESVKVHTQTELECAATQSCEETWLKRRSRLPSAFNPWGSERS